MTRVRSSLNGALSIAVALALSLTACSDKKEVAGGTEAESTIALQVQLADGSPAALSRVRALPVGYLSDGIIQESWDETDENGYVKLNVAPGEYSVEIRGSADSSVQGAVLAKTVEKLESTPVDSVSLGSLTVIEGFVSAGEGPSVIRIPGLERFVVPDSAGHFVIDSLPAGNFEVVIESRSNRGTIRLNASAGDTVPEVSLGAPRGFAVEDFESFDGISATGKILGDGWWFTFDASGKNVMPLWDSSLTRAFAGHEGCVSGGCASIRDGARLGFLLGGYASNYELNDMTSLLFSARGNGKLHVTLDAVDSLAQVSDSLVFDVDLSKVWQGFSLPVGDSGVTLINRIEFSAATGDSVYLDDVFLGGVSAVSLEKASTDLLRDSSVYSEDWKAHSELLSNVVGYASGIRGGEGYIDSLYADSIQGELCIVTTTDDYVIVEDTTNLDSLGNATTSAVVAPGSFRECAYRDSATWIVFKNSGYYNLKAPLRIKSNKTIDGRGRDVRIGGMGIQTDHSTNLIFENLTFTSPSITARDTTSRRAISIHNESHHIWIDHCTFENYPLVEVDVKRGSYGVTISWSRFENADTGILFGLYPNVVDESSQTVTLHHNYFDGLSWSGLFSRRGSLHAYDNFFKGTTHYGVECTDSARCYLENNVFNMANAVTLYSTYVDDVPVDSTMGFVNMIGNWYTVGEDSLKALPGDNSAEGYKPNYSYSVDGADANLAWTIKRNAGPR